MLIINEREYNLIGKFCNWLVLKRKPLKASTDVDQLNTFNDEILFEKCVKFRKDDGSIMKIYQNHACLKEIDSLETIIR